MKSLVDRLIEWGVKRSRYRQPVIDFAGRFLFSRYEFFRPDEHVSDEPVPVHLNKLPWWLPLNLFLHRWEPFHGFSEEFHDHQRWSITICLKGRITEVTPWSRRELRPGSVVVRTHKAIHAFEVPEDQHDAIWTLFIVGRRQHRQNTYEVTPR